MAKSTLARAVAVEAVLGPDDPEVALSLRQLARVHFIIKEYDCAASLFTHCIDILRRMDPPHRLLELDYELLVKCYKKTRNVAAR